MPLRLTLAAIMALAFAFPNLAALWYRADPLTVANESVGYRYLFSERLLHGEGASVWVLAGFLTTAIQTTWLAFLNLFSEATPGELHWRLMIFSYGFSALVVLAAGSVFFAAARNQRLSLLDLCLLMLPALGPAFTTRRSGFYYYTLPDYYHLNVLLTVVAVWLFLCHWRSDRAEAPSLSRIFLLGAFVGIMGSNKITMLPIGLILLGPAVFAPPIGWARFFARGISAASGLAVGFVLIIWWFYLFKVSAVAAMFDLWLGTIRNPGGESDFWSSNFRSHLTGYSYGYIFVFYLVALGLALWAALRDSVCRHRLLVIVGVAALGGAVWCYFIYKRPAGTTFFEAAVALFGFAAVAFAVAVRQSWAPRLISGLLVVWGGYSLLSFQWQGNLAILRESRPWAQHMWRLHGDLLEFARGRDIVVIHPLNHYGYGGVLEFLLKGTADVPSWNVTANGRPVLERYAPRTSYRHEYSGTHPDSPYPENSVLFWVNRPEFPPLTTQYVHLAQAVAHPGVVSRSWSMPIQGGRATIVAHAVLLPPAGEEPAKKRAVVNPPDTFTAIRVGSDTIRLAWTPDPIAITSIQSRSADGEWFALRRLPPASDSYLIKEVNPSVSHVFRARREIEDARSDWVEVALPSLTPGTTP